MGHEFHCTLEEITPEPEISATLFINPTSLSLFVVDLLFFRVLITSLLHMSSKWLYPNIRLKYYINGLTQEAEQMSEGEGLSKEKGGDRIEAETTEDTAHHSVTFLQHDSPALERILTQVPNYLTFVYMCGDIAIFFQYTCHISGPGIVSATANHPTHVLVQLSSCPLPLQVTATLEMPPNTAPTNLSYASLPVAMVSPSHYEVSYLPFVRGRHKLHIKINNRDVDGSPFTVSVYPDPYQLCRPVKVIDEIEDPSSIIVRNREEMIVSESHGDKLTIIKGHTRQLFGSCHEEIVAPSYIVTDDDGNIYMTREHMLLKFDSSEVLIKQVGSERGNGTKEFNDPRGMTLHNKRLYVCDSGNDRVEVYNLNLEWMKTIGSKGKGKLQFRAPSDVKFDTVGNMYVAERENRRVQVISKREIFLHFFGRKELKGPMGLYIVDKHVYVADWQGHSVVVYTTSGKVVTSFGRRGRELGEFRYPYCVTSCADSFIYVCDWNNERVQIF